MAKRTDAPLTHGKEVWKHLEQVEYGRSRNTVFEDWLDLMLSANLSVTDNLKRHDFTEFKERLGNNNFDGEFEERYMGIVERYKDDRPEGKRAVDHFANAYAALWKETIETRKDVLGTLYEARITYGEHGQFFTPEPISQAMAQMALGDIEDGKVISQKENP